MSIENPHKRDAAMIEGVLTFNLYIGKPDGQLE